MHTTVHTRYPRSWTGRALRGHLEAWLGQPLTARCGRDPDAQRAYREALVAAGFERVEEIAVHHRDEVAFAQLVGSVYSAMTPDALPRGADRETFEGGLREVVGGGPFREDVHVRILAGRSPD